MTGAIYIRVSTSDQLEYSPEAQKRAIFAYAEKNNIIIPSKYIFTDEGISGKTAEKRPEFMKMITAAKQKPRPFDVILVHKFDRFARNREDSVVYKSMLKKNCGIKVISITEHIEDDKFSIIFESMLEAMAEYYSINLGEEVKKGMTEKALKGEYQACPPFGYEKKQKNAPLNINEKEAMFVRYIFDEFLNNTPILAIAKKLNKFGLKTHKGNSIDSRLIEYILRNPVYIGYSRWTPTGKINRSFNNPNSIIKKSSHIPIIQEKVFFSAQEKLDKIKTKHASNYSKNPQYKHWLSGILKCSNCKSSLVKNGNKYFQCSYYTKGKCNISHSLNVKTAETIVSSEIAKFLSLLKPVYITVPDKKNSLLETNIVISQIASEEKKLTRIKEAYMSGIDSLTEYEKNKKEIFSKINKLKKQIPNKNKKNSVPINIQLSDILTSSLSDKFKNAFLKSIVNKIEYNKKENTLSLYFYF